MLRAESGYPQGTIGLGIDAIRMQGEKLDSSNDRAGTALFPIDRELVVRQRS